MTYSILILLAFFLSPLFHPPSHVRACSRPRDQPPLLPPGSPASPTATSGAVCVSFYSSSLATHSLFSSSYLRLPELLLLLLQPLLLWLLPLLLTSLAQGPVPRSPAGLGASPTALISSISCLRIQQDPLPYQDLLSVSPYSINAWDPYFLLQASVLSTALFLLLLFQLKFLKKIRILKKSNSSHSWQIQHPEYNQHFPN